MRTPALGNQEQIVDHSINRTAGLVDHGDDGHSILLGLKKQTEIYGNIDIDLLHMNINWTAGLTLALSACTEMAIYGYTDIDLLYVYMN